MVFRLLAPNNSASMRTCYPNVASDRQEQRAPAQESTVTRVIQLAQGKRQRCRDFMYTSDADPRQSQSHVLESATQTVFVSRAPSSRAAPRIVTRSSNEGTPDDRLAR